MQAVILWLLLFQPTWSTLGIFCRFFVLTKRQLLVNYTTSGNQGGQTWCRFAFAETIDQAAFDNGIFFEYSPCDDSAVYNLTAWYDGLGGKNSRVGFF